MTEHEPNLRFQNGDASGLAANQSASNIESAIGSGQKLVKVVAGNPAREFRIIMLDTISVPVAQRLQLCVDTSNSASALNGCVHLLIIHPADSHASAVVEQNVHRLKIVDSLPAICACAPQELFPSMPPNVQCVCVAGSGPQVNLSSSAACRNVSQIVPG